LLRALHDLAAPFDDAFDGSVDIADVEVYRQNRAAFAAGLLNIAPTAARRS